jgi:hypothetical protein
MVSEFLFFITNRTRIDRCRLYAGVSEPTLDNIESNTFLSGLNSNTRLSGFGRK